MRGRMMLAALVAAVSAMLVVAVAGWGAGAAPPAQTGKRQAKALEGVVASQRATDTYVKKLADGRTEVRGWITEVHIDGQPGRGGSETEYRLTTKSGRTYVLDLSDASSVISTIAGKRSAKAALASQQVVVARGAVAGDTLRVATATAVAQLAPYGLHPITSDPATRRGRTIRKVRVLPVMFADDPAAGPYSLTDFKAQLTGPGRTVANYFALSSKGLDSGAATAGALAGDVEFQFTVEPWKKLTINRTGTACSDTPALMDTAAVNRLFGIDPLSPTYAAYDHYMYLRPCDGRSNGSIDGPQTSIEERTMPRQPVLSHELGHNVGLGHSNAASCRAGGIPVPVNGECGSVEYGDRSDVMGDWFGMNASSLLTPFHRVQLGFIPTPNTQTLVPAQGATATVATGTIRLSDDTPQLIRIARPRAAAAGEQRPFYTLSIRTAETVFDTFSATNPLVAGVSLHAVPADDDDSMQPNLIDANPAGRDRPVPAALRADNLGIWLQEATLRAGRSFYDAQEDYTITVRSAGSSLATVTVENGPPRSAATAVAVLDGVLRVRSTGTAANDVVLGRAGTDIRVADFGNAVTAGAGCRRVDAQTAACTAANVTRIEVETGPGNDQASATPAVTLPLRLDGGAGDDTLVAGGGRTTLLGGAGADRLAPVNPQDVISFADTAGPVRFEELGTTAGSSPTVAYSPQGNDEILPPGPSETTARATYGELVGSAGADILRLATAAGAGRVLEGGPGRDVLQTGTGQDTIRARDGEADVSINCGGSGDGDRVVRDAADSSVVSCETTDTAAVATIAVGPRDGARVKPGTVYTLRAYTSPEALQCRVLPDLTTWATCASAFAVPTLAAGTKTLEVRSTAVPATVARRSFVLDATAPTLTLVSRPTGTLSGRHQQVTVTSSEPGTLRCALDGAAATVCLSPVVFTDLPDGAHSVTVQGVDEAGNASAALAPITWTVDRTAPDTSITGGPPATTTDPRPVFAFTGSGAGLTDYQCRIVPTAAGATVPDWAVCATGFRPAAELVDGGYRFEVRARDALGNADPSPATRSFTLAGGAGTITLDPVTHEVTITGGPGKRDTINGFQDGDTLYIYDTTAPLVAGTGCVQAGSNGARCTGVIANVEINGGGGDDVIAVDADAAIQVWAGDGDDTISGGSPEGDLFSGGSGTDTVTYAGESGAVQASNDGRANDGPVGAAVDLIGAEVEQIVGGQAADTLTSATRPTVLRGGPGNDTLTAGAGGATLEGGAGNDRLVPGSGPDTLDMSRETSPVAIGPISTAGATGGDALAGPFETVLGGSGADLYTDGPGDQVVRLGAGDDSVVEGPGSDTYYGDAGNDKFRPSPTGGTDTYWGGAGMDTVDYTAWTTPVKVTLDELRNDGDVLQTAQLDDLREIETVIGGSGPDVLTGNQGRNSLDGGAGDDVLDGRGGDDFFNGDDGIDTLSYAGRDGDLALDVLDSTLSQISGGAPDEGDYGFYLERVIGGNGNDRMTVADSPDVDGWEFQGGAGDDTLTGGQKADKLVGGTGTDTIASGGGDDTVDAKDGVTETVDCGAGTGDRATVDTTDVLSGCELPTTTAAATAVPTAFAGATPLGLAVG